MLILKRYKPIETTRFSGSGIPEDTAKIYESGIDDGHVVMGVRPRNDEDADYLEQNGKSNRGSDIYR